MGIRSLFLALFLAVRPFTCKYAGAVFLLLLVALTGQAQAELNLGVLKGQNCLPASTKQAEQLATWLQTQLGEPVRVRIFNSPTLLHQWMNRYREVDFGLLPLEFINRFHPIEFQRLLTYEAGNPQLRPTALVGRRGLQQGTIQQLRDLLLTMDTDAEGNRLLTSMGVAAYQAPGGDRVVLRQTKPAAPKTRLVRRREARPSAPAPAPAPEAAVLPRPKRALPKPAPVRQTKVTVKPARTQTAEADKPARTQTAEADKPARTQTAAADKAAKAAAKAAAKPESVAPDTTKIPVAPAASAPETRPAKQSTEVRAEEDKSSQRSAKAALQTSAPTARDIYSRHKEPHGDIDEEAFSSRGRRYLWVIAVILLLGGLGKLLLIARNRPRRRPAARLAPVVLQHDWSRLHGDQPTSPEPADRRQTEQQPQAAHDGSPAETNKTDQTVAKKAATPDAPPEKQSSENEDLELLFREPVQVPRVLARIAQAKISGTLRVTAKHNEKVLTFDRGLLTSASSRNLATKTQSGFLMNKLGYLLIRQGKITEEDRDRALVLCEGNPSLRLGEALIQLGALKRSELMRSLQDQAKMILHSLIVFPEGDFHFEPGHPAIAPEDNLRLPIEEFLREAGAHEHEWNNIRAMIPSLDTVLEFAPGGREKVNGGRLTVHQKFVLSLIDGQRRIRDICVDATMLDYELYRFLYLMVKADILRRVENRQDNPAACKS